jgi:ADP-L-glycero-D-manno-heptose 6-epimerase
MHIWVTGGAGFVGANLVYRLQHQHPDAHLLVIDDLRTGTFDNLCRPDQPPFGGTVIARPLHEIDLARLAQRRPPDVIYHEASITDTTVDDQSLMIRDNLEPFEDLLDLAVQRGIPLVWASSAATYGIEANGATAAQRPFELGDAGHPANVYGFSKWLMENAARQQLQQHPDAHIVGLRYFNVFGPGEQNKGKMASMIHQLAGQMRAGQRPRIFTDGSQARDQVVVHDVVGATMAGAREGASSGVYNVGSGQTTSFNQIVAALNDAMGTSLEPEYIDNPYSFYQDYTCADLTATRDGLDWQPEHDPADAIADYARWLVEHA